MLTIAQTASIMAVLCALIVGIGIGSSFARKQRQLRLLPYCEQWDIPPQREPGKVFNYVGHQVELQNRPPMEWLKNSVSSDGSGYMVQSPAGGVCLLSPEEKQAILDFWRERYC